MILQDKYKSLVNMASQGGVKDLNVKDQGNILYITGVSPTADLKNKLWDEYNRIDPNFRDGDLVMDIDVESNAGDKAKVITKESNLNIRKGPGVDQAVIGKAAHHSMVTILGKANDQWSLIRNENDEEGYVYTQYLEIV